MKLWDRLRAWFRTADATQKEQRGTPDTKDDNPPDAPLDPIERNLEDTRNALLYWAAFSYLLILIYGLSFWSGKPDYTGFTEFVAIFSKGSLLALAFASIGALFGFVFGIPITQGSAEAKVPEGQGKAGGTEPGRQPYQRTNTSVEQISDWLTKILVGVGLTQLQSIPDKLSALGAHFAPAFGGSSAVPLVIILNFSICGFFAGYLLTRLFLEKAFDDMRNAVQKAEDKEKEASKKVEEVSAKVSKPLQAEVSSIPAGADTEAQKERRRKLVEELIFANLYEAPPDGFTKAIENATKYLGEPTKLPSGLIEAYLAMAYGQKCKWEKEHGTRMEALGEFRDNAFASAKKAVDAGQKNLLRTVWDRRTAQYDDDLVVFYDDPEFKKLLG